MKIRSLVAAANIGLMFLLVVGNAAEAAELKVLSAIAMTPVMEDLGPKFVAKALERKGVTEKEITENFDAYRRRRR